MHLVFLPATEPNDLTFGSSPDRISGRPDLRIHTVRFPHLVWYNAQVRREAAAQIEALGAERMVLFGFSKSGLGAWNLARELPHRIAATVIFDAPVARRKLPNWGTAPFYPGDEAWRTDLPMENLETFRTAVSLTHRLILISGANFHTEMVELSEALKRARAAHTFLPRPDLKHHWDSGWINLALREL
ncbi:MAG: hypothetical protein AMXMBFR7_05650 [Planctomycetota bacterium]